MKKKSEILKETLSYTELQSVKEVLAGVKDEKVIVASELAKKRSRGTIVNGLKMLKVAGVIETQSLGMKGTYIKVLDQETLEELLRY